MGDASSGIVQLLETPYLLVHSLLLRFLHALDSIVLDGLLAPALVHHRVDAFADWLVNTAASEAVS